MTPKELAVHFATSVTALSLLTAAGTSDAKVAPDQRLGVAEAFRNTAQMDNLGAGWERIILPWNQIQPNAPGDFSNLGRTISQDALQGEINRGIKIAGLLQFTPQWAAVNPADGARAVPQGLFLPYDDPNNFFGQYAYQTAQFYRGKIDQWVIWNEPEFKVDDPGAGGSYTWTGTDQEFAQLLKVGYKAIKKANPEATVSFPGMSYWIDVTNNRPLFYDRILQILQNDPDARNNNFYHDVTSFNLYRSPDDIYRVNSTVKTIQKKYQLDKPLWLTETNAMPADDSAIPCANEQTNRAFVKTTLEEQAAFGIQAFALAAAAGYERIEFYQMIDSNTCQEPAVWGIIRDDGTQRPVSLALKTVMENMSGYTKAQFLPTLRSNTAVCLPSCWPDDQNAYVPNYEIYQIVLDKPNRKRVTILWNGDGTDIHAQIRQSGTSARLIDKKGLPIPTTFDNGVLLITLPAATAHFSGDPQGYYYIGGDPIFLVEDDVDQQTPVTPVQFIEQ